VPVPLSQRVTSGEAIVGFRPEDLYDRSPPVEAPIRLPAHILAVEPLGAETLVVAALSGHREEVIARVGRDSALVPGMDSLLWLDGGAVHVFDPGGNAALSSAGGRT
jgi:multiple sugar transport system ATP-binding protein